MLSLAYCRYYTREAAQGTLTDLRLASNTALNVDIAPVGLNQLLECYASWQRLCSAQEMAQRRFHLVRGRPMGASVPGRSHILWLCSADVKGQHGRACR